MGPSIVSVAVGLLVLSLVFWPIEWRWPAIVRPSRMRAGLGTDLLYWFFTPLVTRVVSRAGVLLAVTVLVSTYGIAPSREAITAFLNERTTWVQRQPFGLQLLEVLLLGDLVGYWTHRLFHRRFLWKFHAVHHSSTEVDWLSSVRLHPVNDLLSKVAQVIALLLAGFPPTLLAAYVPFLSFYAILLHANVSWDFGPLRSIVASPRFHRWHHTSEAEGLDKNFAGLFPFLDRIFGTLYLPEDRAPRRFGVEGEPVPPRFLAQLVYPFRRRTASPTS